MSNRSSYVNESQRAMMQPSGDFSQRFGSAHMNELAMEYFQSASLSGKTSDQIIKEF